MLDKFSSYINTLSSGIDNKRYVLAVSGGKDSMVLLDLCLKLDLDVIVGHIDHQTREGQSTIDAKFVEDYCRQKSVPFFCDKFHFDKGNFQHEARLFRYKFLIGLAMKEQADYILTAHHADDNVESVLIALSKGEGFSGLQGIQEVRGKFLRPLLYASRAMIDKYSDLQEIDFVQDQSNYLNQYTRNKIRNLVIPSFKEAVPQFDKGIQKSIDLIKIDFRLFNELIKQLGFQAIKKDKDHQIIDLDQIEVIQEKENLLFHFLREYGFTFSQCTDMIASLTGSTFDTIEFEALKDRNNIVVRKKQKNKKKQNQICLTSGKYTFRDCSLIINIPKSMKFNSLCIRSKGAGDQVLLHNGLRKSIKKYLIDKKINRWDKENVLVLEIDSQVVDLLYPQRVATKNHLKFGLEISF